MLGSGFTGVQRVTFGGVRATRFVVHGPDRITVTYPRMSATTACTPLPHTGVYRGETARNDICQVQVRVYTPGGVSSPTTIRPPLEGPISANVMGVLVAPDCKCEVAQTADEFDYLPRPRIDAVSTSGGPTTLASEHGGSVITVKGVGLNPLDIDWADFGDPAREASVQVGYAFLSGTEMQISAPRHDVTLGIDSVPVSVRTLAGQSNAKTVRYAGLPVATKVINLSNAVTVDGLSGASTVGGTPIEVQGQHFRGQVLSLQIVGLNPAEGSGGTQYNFKLTGDTTLRTADRLPEPGARRRRTVHRRPAVPRGRCPRPGALPARIAIGDGGLTKLGAGGRRDADHDYRPQSRLSPAGARRRSAGDQRRPGEIDARLRLDDDADGGDPRGNARAQRCRSPCRPPRARSRAAPVARRRRSATAEPVAAAVLRS